MEIANLESLKKIAHSFAKHFGNNCEIIIHDLERENLEDTIVYIENGHVSNRQLGNVPSQIVLESLARDISQLEDNLCYLTKTKDGRVLKSSTLYFADACHEKVKYILSINYDITSLLAVDNGVQSLISTEKKSKNIITETHQNVNDILNELLEKSAALIGKPPVLMSKEEKIVAIDFLNKAGAFLITKSGDKVSKYFGISKYTLYSYTDVNR